MSFLSKKLNPLTLIIVALIAFQLGTSKGQLECKVCAPEDVDFSLFWEAYNELQDKFVKEEVLIDQNIIYGAIQGMTASLNDPYTIFFSPSETQTFLEDVNGHFEGVGMEIGIRNEQLQVIAPLRGTPAEKAGFMSGDQIVSIDETSTIDLTVEEAVGLIRGPKGTDVTLTVYRASWEELKDITVTRDVIEVPSLEWEIIDDNIAYVQLYQFSRLASNDFRKAAYEIINSDVDKIILDLRNNPGGYLEVSIDIAGWFLDRDEVVVVEKFRDGQEQIHTSKGNGLFNDYNVVVLINQGSASASEILSGALRDNNGTLLIGKKSFGKGSVQQLDDLTGGSSLKITIAEWLTPNGNFITEIGLEPDIEVDYTEEDYLNSEDPQLLRAIEVIKEL